MTTNYYIGRHDGSVAHPGNEQDMHIGLSAIGWAFQFQAKIAKSVVEWRERLDNLPGEYVIVSDNGHVFDRAEFWAMVEGTKRHAIRHQRSRPEHPVWIDQGYDFCDYEFS